MPSANKTPNYGFPQWAGNEYLKREDMNEAFAIADRELNRVDAALRSFDALAMQPGHRTTDTLTTQDGLDTWTSVITDAGGHEVARKVDVEGRIPIPPPNSGERGLLPLPLFAQWTTTITIGDKVVTIVDTETANGWTREVK